MSRYSDNKTASFGRGGVFVVGRAGLLAILFSGAMTASFASMAQTEGQASSVAAPAAVGEAPVGMQVDTPSTDAPQTPASQNEARRAAAQALMAQQQAPQSTAAQVAASMQRQTKEEIRAQLFDDDLKVLLGVKSSLRASDITLDDLGSVLFRPYEYSVLQEAKAGFSTRRPTESELRAAQEQGLNFSLDEVVAAPPRPEPGIRELSLGGIAYISGTNWTVWFNGQRVLPNAIPKEILDIKVSRHHIDVKWYDAYTNLIYPVRIRPHQRFNLDSRMFLPGEAVSEGGI